MKQNAIYMFFGGADFISSIKICLNPVEKAVMPHLCLLTKSVLFSTLQGSVKI